jgi:hypothetical protein
MLYALCFIDMAGQADINKQLKKRLFEWIHTLEEIMTT